MAEKKNGDILYADDFNGKQDKFGTVSYISSPKYLSLRINGYVDPTSGKFVQLSDSDITSTKITITSAEFQNKTTFLESLMLGTTLNGFNFELPTATTPGTIKTSRPGINKLNFSNGTGASDIQLGGIATPTVDNDVANKKYVDTKQDKFATVLGSGSKLILSKETATIANNTEQRGIVFGSDYISIGGGGGNFPNTGLQVKPSYVRLNTPTFVEGVGLTDAPASLLGVATPLSAANTTLGITADDLPYQAVNKKYVDDKIAELTAKIEALSK